MASNTPPLEPSSSLSENDQNLMNPPGDKDPDGADSIKSEIEVDITINQQKQTVQVRRHNEQHAGNMNSPAVNEAAREARGNSSNQINRHLSDARPRTYFQRQENRDGPHRNGSPVNLEKQQASENIDQPSGRKSQSPLNSSNHEVLGDQIGNEQSVSLNHRAKVSDVPSLGSLFREKLNAKHGLLSMIGGGVVGGIIGGIVGTLVFPGVGTVTGILYGVYGGAGSSPFGYLGVTGLRSWWTRRKLVANQSSQAPAGRPPLNNSAKVVRNASMVRRDPGTKGIAPAIRETQAAIRKNHAQEFDRRDFGRIEHALATMALEWSRAANDAVDNSDPALQICTWGAGIVNARRDQKRIESERPQQACLRTEKNARKAAKDLVIDLILIDNQQGEKLISRTMDLAYASSLYTRARFQNSQQSPTEEDYWKDLASIVQDACRKVPSLSRLRRGESARLMKQRLSSGESVHTLYQTAVDVARTFPQDGLIHAAADYARQTLRTTIEAITSNDEVVTEVVNRLDAGDQLVCDSVWINGMKPALLDSLDQLAFTRDGFQEKGSVAVADHAPQQHEQRLELLHQAGSPKVPANPGNGLEIQAKPGSANSPNPVAGGSPIQIDDNNGADDVSEFDLVIRALHNSFQKQYSQDEVQRIETALRTISNNIGRAVHNHLPNDIASEMTSQKLMTRQAARVATAMKDQRRIESPDSATRNQAGKDFSARANAAATQLVAKLMSQEDVDADEFSSAVLDLAYCSSLYTKTRLRDANQAPTIRDYDIDLQFFVSNACQLQGLNKDEMKAECRERMTQRIGMDGGVRTAVQATERLMQQLERGQLQPAARFAQLTLHTLIETIASEDSEVQLTLKSLCEAEPLPMEEISTNKANGTLLKDIDELAFTRIDGPIKGGGRVQDPPV